MNIERQHISGLVLAGGRGTRMGGVDKGLQPYLGLPLALHALLRLQPQVGALMISANRNLPTYATWGAPVWPDAVADFPGPLGGLLAGLVHCETPYLVTVPCDTPHFPFDLVPRLAQSLASAQADVAVAATWDEGQQRLQPVFALVRAALQSSLLAYVQRGEHKTAAWMRQQRFVEVLFSDAASFSNANSLAELKDLEQLLPART